jgi:hypothetical protein
MKIKLSLARLHANRRNALKSTGQKTPRGRAISKMNALSHGILSTQIMNQKRIFCQTNPSSKRRKSLGLRRFVPFRPFSECAFLIHLNNENPAPALYMSASTENAFTSSGANFPNWQSPGLRHSVAGVV